MPGCQTPNQHPCQHPNKCTHIGSPGRPAALRPACPSDPAPPWHMHRHCSCRQCRQQLASARGWWWMRVTCMCKSGASLAGSADSNWHVRGHWDPPPRMQVTQRTWASSAPPGGTGAGGGGSATVIASTGSRGVVSITKGLASPVCYISYILYTSIHTGLCIPNFRRPSHRVPPNAHRQQVALGEGG